MELYDAAQSSLDVERYILEKLGMYRAAHHAKEEALAGESIYKVTINVEEIDA